MAGLTHLGVGMAAKRVIPGVPVWLLVVAAYAIDLVFGVFWAMGLDHLPTGGAATIAPWSHGLLMSAVWSVAFGLGAWLASRNRRMGLAIGLLVFSHWVVDFIAKPMLHAFPGDAGLPLLFDGSPTVGLGLWRTAAGEYIGEYAVTALLALVYVFDRLKRRNAAKSLAQEGGLS
ncbi:MAG: hypothetical protein ACM3UP_01500 [Methanocella sp.]